MSDKQEIERLLSYAALSDEERSRLRKLVASLLAANESLAKDAERYRKWRELLGEKYMEEVHYHTFSPDFPRESMYKIFDRYRDEEIAAALAASASAKERTP